MNERDKKLAEQCVGIRSYDNSFDWQKFAELIRADEREACAKLCDDAVKINLDAKSEFAKIKSDCINAKLAAQIKAFKASIESAIEVSEKTAIAIRARGEVK